GRVEAGIGLGNEHNRRRMPPLGFGEGLLHPRDVGGVARGELRRIWRRVAKVVAGTLNVQSRISYAPDRPAAVFDTGHITTYPQADWRELHFLMQAMLAEGKRRAEKQRSLVVQALQ